MGDVVSDVSNLKLLISNLSNVVLKLSVPNKTLPDESTIIPTFSLFLICSDSEIGGLNETTALIPPVEVPVYGTVNNSKQSENSDSNLKNSVSSSV